ncbi:hypothetical protein V8F33_006693 [Rhypophila sp. PSN 637]
MASPAASRTVGKMQLYQGRGIRYADGKLGLACVKDVKDFASYLRKQSTKNPKATCYHAFGWAKDPLGVVTLTIAYLSLTGPDCDSNRPWSRGEAISVVPGKTHTTSCPLSELAGHIEWYWGFSIRAEQIQERKRVEDERKRREEEILKQIKELERRNKLAEMEYAARMKKLDENHVWQLKDQQEDDEMTDIEEEVVAGTGDVQSRGQGNAAIAAGTATEGAPAAAAT